MSEPSGGTFPLVLSAPSGAGKTTLAKALRERRPDVVFSVSVTTRAPRGGEVDGVHYHFVPRAEFDRMKGAGELIEWAEVHGNGYGTPRKGVEEARAEGKYLLLDIDVQGAAQIRRAVPEAVHVFVLPPSGEELVRRLVSRGSETDEVVQRRLANARDEVRRAPGFDRVIVNDQLARAVDDLEAILDGRGDHLRPDSELAARVERICDEIERHLLPR